MTARIAIRFRRPVPINRELRLTASVVSTRRRRLEIAGELLDGEDVLAAAEGTFLHVPLEHFLSTPEGRAAGEAWRARLA